MNLGNIWLDFILKIEDDAKSKGTLSIIEQLTLVPKLLAMGLLIKERANQSLPPAE